MPDYSGWGYRGSLGWIKHVGDDFAFSLAASAQREKNGFPDFRTFGWNTPANSGATPANPAGNTGDLNGDGVPDNTTWGLNTEIKEVTQDRYAISGGAGWRVNDELTIKGDALWSQYEIKENQFQAWYGNNITGNWANGNSSIYNAPGNSYQIVNGSVVAADLNNAFPNYESEIARYDEKHTLAVLGLERRVENRRLGQPGRRFLFRCLAHQPLAGNRAIGCLPAQSGIQRHRRSGTLWRNAGRQSG